MDRTTLDEILLPPHVYGTCGSKTTVYNLEKIGKFPKRLYLDADSPNPRRPFWLKREVETWLADQVAMAEEARARAGLTGARLVKARHPTAA